MNEGGLVTLLPHAAIAIRWCGGDERQTALVVRGLGSPRGSDDCSHYVWTGTR